MSLSKRQLELRRQGIGASEIATLAGLSPFGSLIDVWRSKVEEKPNRATSYQMELGTELEAPLAKVWATRRGLYLAKVDTLRHHALPYALATPDRAVYSDATKRGDGRKLRTFAGDADLLLQVKSSSWRMRREWGRGVSVFEAEEGAAGEGFTDLVPEEYWIQVQWEMAVADVRTCAVIVDFDKRDLWEYRVHYSPEIFLGLYDLAARFMRDHVEPRVPPAPDWTDRYADFVRKTFPQEKNDRLRPLVPENEPTVWSAIHRVLELREVGARVKARIEEAERVVELAIAEDTGLTFPGGKVTWKKNRDSVRVDESALVLELQRIAGLAVAGLPAGDLREQLAGQLKAAPGAHTRTVAGPRVMRWKVEDAPKRIGEDPRAALVELGGTVLDLPPVSAPRVTASPAALTSSTTKEGTQP